VEAGRPQQAPTGTYLSRELNALAVIAESEAGATWQCGATEPVPMIPISLQDHWRLPTGIVVVRRDSAGEIERVLVSAARMRHVAFEPYVPEDHPPAFPVGFPVPFGGPAA